MNKRHLFLALSLFCFGFWSWTSAQESSSPPVEEKQIEESPDLSAEFSLLQEEVKKLRLAEEEESTKAVTPVQIQIPSINVDTAIEQVGVLDNGQMGVPVDENQVGWFEPGVKPGSKGNAVVAGHVDSKTGPAVFYELDQLKTGDDVTIIDENGNTLRFRVTKTESYDTKNAPIDEIFGTTSNRNLNLITCSGTFGDGGYDQRFVVYTELVDSEIKSTVELAAPTNVTLSGNLLTWHAVRDDAVIGYRVYEVIDGNATRIESVPSHARKSVEVTNEQATYYVTAIDRLGNESKPSQTAK
ncbi:MULTISPECIES: class F sortase [unclassified Exiguobacterium]|uniref:class F sortase n=1 Tax=unclassified Exiguobacterium TaxID=2644629 RepID=UPI00103AF8CE|nr:MULTISPECIES: class F sortase [unclassified Exiguobacterium]TCI44273.1 class F sortase [Exiguobacterium sp. SH5S32]TCI50538.1 class F sortase [Exiguobacterium sp. SH1S4]TCI69497.1 class F sortase [Exiguobacterium sp. SH1S1]